MGDEHERLRRGVEPIETTERHSRDAADDLKHALGGRHEIVAAARRDRDSMDRLELRATPLRKSTGGAGLGRVGTTPLLYQATLG